MNKKVLLLLSNGFEELEAAAFTDVMGWSRSDGLEPVDLTVGAIKDTLAGTWNLTITPQLVITSASVAEAFDALAIPGGFEEAGYYEDAYNPLFLDIIREFERAKKTIATICVGALPVGKSGILKDRRATTYHLCNSIRPNQLSAFGVKTEKKHLVVDNNIITSCGPSSALDVAFLLLERLTGRENRETVQRAMGFQTTVTLE